MTFLTGYNGILNVINSNNNLFSAKTITDKDGSLHINLPPGAYEVENLNDQIKRIKIEDGYFTEAEYPFKIKPIHSTLCSTIEFFRQKPLISFISDDSIKDLLGFNANTI